MYKNKSRVFIIVCILAIATSVFSYLLAKMSLEENKNILQTEEELIISDQKKMFSYSYEEETLTDIINSYLNEHDLQDDEIAIAYYNFHTKESYYHNSDTLMFAASTYKLPLSMYYYEMIIEGKIENDALLLYDENCIEDDEGYIYNNYEDNSYIPLSLLLHECIVNSDNNAALILIQNLGGWNEMMNAISKYSPSTITLTNENTFSARYMLEVVKHLYFNADYFNELLTKMKNAEPNAYFKKYVQKVEIAHKYGNLNMTHNDVGIIYTKNPYALAIFSNVIGGQSYVAQINRIIYEYETIKNEP